MYLAKIKKLFGRWNIGFILFYFSNQVTRKKVKKGDVLNYFKLILNCLLFSFYFTIKLDVSENKVEKGFLFMIVRFFFFLTLKMFCIDSV